MRKFLTSFDKAQCRECGKYFKRISWTHLKKYHYMTTKQYINKYSLFKGELLSRGTRLLMQSNCSRLWKNKILKYKPILISKQKRILVLNKIRNKMKRINSAMGKNNWIGLSKLEISKEVSRRKYKYWTKFNSFERKSMCKQLSRLGYTPWNKGLKGVQVAWNKGTKNSS